jgi:DnaJ-domain-containing protein 1
MIDGGFGNRARKSLQNLKDENLPAVDQSVSLLRLWLTTGEHSPHTQTREVEPISSKDIFDKIAAGETEEPSGDTFNNIEEKVNSNAGGHVEKQPETNNFLLALAKGILGLILFIVSGGVIVYGFYRTRTKTKVCDPCKARMDYEAAKKAEYERQDREASIKAEERRKREDAQAREKQKRDEDARRKAKEQEENARAQERRKREEEAKDRKSSEYEAGANTTEVTGFDPNEVLQVNRGTSKDEMKVAYYRLLKQYHPDKVSHLGKEFQKMAEEKTQIINRAYEILTSV